MGILFVQADARRMPLLDDSVQCVVTSPPYWGLRKYAGEQELVWGGSEDCPHEWETERYYTEQTAAIGSAEAFSKAGESNKKRLKAGRWRETNSCFKCGAWRGAFGLEPTVEMYVQHTLEVLREIRRVLRSDGVVFWNIADSYAGSGYSNHKNTGGAQRSDGGRQKHVRCVDGLKPKDLCLIPQRVALAAQEDGWWVRSAVPWWEQPQSAGVLIWVKPNPMPESCRDRPTDCYETILILTKSARYYWDAEAVAEPSLTTDIRRPYTSEGAWALDGRPVEQRHGGKPRGGKNAFRGQGAERESPNGPANRDGRDMEEVGAGLTRNLRNVWMFPTQPYKGAHFAVFPEALPRRCILAATSEKGCCPKCGAPWARIVERKHTTAHTGSTATAYEKGSNAHRLALLRQAAREEGAEFLADVETVAWRPACDCGVEETTPCLVLDPFAGTGTTGKVAAEMGRRAVLCDLAYSDQASARLGLWLHGLANLPAGRDERCAIRHRNTEAQRGET